MKLHLPLSLRSSLLAIFGLLGAGATCAHAESSTGSDTSLLGNDWGNTVYIGDSITHGFNARSYRWFLFKNLVDIDATQTEVGVQSGYVQSSVTTNTVYGSTAYDNLHAAQSGITASQVAGTGYSQSNLLGGTGLSTWLSGNGSYKLHTSEDANSLAVPDTAFVMLGTNDIFGLNSEGVDLDDETLSSSSTTTLDYFKDSLLTSMKSIVSQLQAASAAANTTDDKAGTSTVNVIITAIPTWSETRGSKSNGTSEAYAKLTELNKTLAAWATETEGVTFVDINKGLINVANTSTPGAGAAGLFNSDAQHPNEQGNLIIAGNIAQQLGYAGRTAGQERKAASDFSYQKGALFADALSDSGSLVLANGSSLIADWSTVGELGSAFTVDFGFANGLGNGATDGWLTSANFSVSLSNGSDSGVLNVNEACIQWGSKILYSMDTSTLKDSLRVAYVCGDSTLGLNDGFYVWMGDMLIGEGLSSSGSTSSAGITLTNNSGDTVQLSSFSLAAGAWAPTSTGISYGNPTIDAREGNSSLTTIPVTLTNKTFNNTDSAIRNLSAVESGNNASITVEGGTLNSQWLVASYGNFTGDVDVTLKGSLTQAQANSYNVGQYTGTLHGSLHLTVEDGFSTTSTTWRSFIGVDGSGAVEGDITMVFSSGNLVVTNSGSGRSACAISGSYACNVEGAVNIIINAGSFTGNIYGAMLNKGQYVGGTQITLNGGTVTGDVYGGIANSNSANINVGTISGDSAVTVTGGATVTGNIYAGGQCGTVNGNAVLTVKEVKDGDKFAQFNKILSGYTSNSSAVTGSCILRFDDTQLSSFGATLQNFDSLQLINKSDVALNSLGGASEVSVEADSRLELTAGTHAATFYNNGTVSVKEGATLTLVGQDGNMSGTFEINGGTLNIEGYDKLESHFNINSGSLSNEGTKLAGGVSIDVTGNVALSGVEASDITSLQTQAAVQVSGLSGVLSLDTVTLTLGAANQTTDSASLQFTDGGLSVDTLTLNIANDITLNRSSAGGQLLVNRGSLNAGAVNLNHAAENTSITYTGITTTETGYSYVTYKAYTTRELTGSTDTPITIGNTNSNAIANQAISAAGLASTGGNIAIAVNGPTTLSGSYLIGCRGGYTGDVQIALGGTLNRGSSGGYNVLQWTGTLKGSISLSILSGFTTTGQETWSSFIGADDSTVQGDLSMEFSSDSFKVSSTGSGRACALAGAANNGDVTGKVDITINAGKFNGNIYGGGLSSSDSVGKGTHVTLNGGTVTGDVYGGGKDGNITGGSAVTVTGKATVNGNIYAGSAAGTLDGNARLTIREVAEGDSFAAFSGTLSGGIEVTNGTRTLCFENAQLNSFAATLQNFDAVALTDASSVTLSDLGGASSLSIEGGSHLTLTGENSLSLTEALFALTLDKESQSASSALLSFTNGGSLSIVNLTLDLSAEVCEWLVSAPATMALTDASTAAESSTTQYGQLLLAKGSLSADTIVINMAEGYEGYSISALSIDTDTDGYSYVNYSLTSTGAVPEPTTATLSLLALAGLVARRRRR